MNRESSIKNPYTDFIEKLMHSNSWQYWSLQTVGWSGYTFFVLSSAFLLDKADTVHNIYIMFATSLGFLLSVVMHKGFKLIWDAPPVKQLLLSLLTVALITGLWSSWKFYVAMNLYHEFESGKMLTEYLYWYSYSFFIILSWAGLYYGIKYFKVAQQEKEKTLQASAMAHQAQLKMLRYQLNPHFLFNTLNSISTFILENQSRRLILKGILASKYSMFRELLNFSIFWPSSKFLAQSPSCPDYRPRRISLFVRLSQYLFSYL